MREPFGWLVLDKPHSLTSRAAVDAAARWFPHKTAIGHTGTLDPLATGVLVLAVGRATRLAEYVQQQTKVYDAEFTLGATSVTDDSEGPITPSSNPAAPSRDVVDAVLAQFIGEIQQTPPAYSAVKIGGRRAYKHARAGKTVLPAAKSVRIDRIDELHYVYPTLRLTVTCGKGTYIRSLARDLGAQLGVGGYVSALRRTAVGPFTLDEATPLDTQDVKLLPLERCVHHLPSIVLREPDVKRFRMGQTVEAESSPIEGVKVAAFDLGGRLVAIARALANGRWQPVRVLWQLTDEVGQK